MIFVISKRASCSKDGYVTLQKSLRNSDLISRTASRFSKNDRSSQWLQAESFNHYWMQARATSKMPKVCSARGWNAKKFGSFPFVPLLFAVVGGANSMLPLSVGGRNGKDPKILYTYTEVDFHGLLRISNLPFKFDSQKVISTF